MELTEKQQEALQIATTRYLQGEPYTCISGYAGVGKTTLIQFIVQALNLYSCDVCYVAYTGKAALVLKEKGCENAMTLHRLLYTSFRKPNGQYIHKEKHLLDYPYKLIVVDEVSMVPREMWDLLLSHKIHVIALGDPGQLPPIGEDNDILKSPHIFLDEVVRQAQDNEIIKLTMGIREGKALLPYKGKQVQIINKEDLIDGMLLWADQIICAKNETRKWLNTHMRKLLYNVEDNEPIENDKVICLKNNWDNINDMGDVMVNGTIGTLSYIRKEEHPILNPLMRADFLPDGYVPSECELDPCFNDLNIDYKLLTEGEPTVNEKNYRMFPKQWMPQEFDYGYAITCWKAQGSEYNKVLVFEENFPFDEEEHKKYLYTAATRAKEKLIIVRK